MDGYSISQVAQRTGFPASTLRFYERSGLVHPVRSPAGYRRYDDGHIERLSFIGRAKGFGLTLDEITELLGVLDDERCAPVQSRLRDLIDTKIADAQQHIIELVAFTAELQRVSATLSRHTPDGPCDDACGCTTDRIPGATALVPAPWATGSDDPPIVCTLGAGHIGDRVAEWRAVLSEATTRERAAGGVSFHFPAEVDLASLAALAMAEQDCCRFLTFGLTIEESGVVLDITGPDDAQPIISALAGASS